MIIGLLLNIIIIVSEIYVLSRLKNKIDIFKYYTYLQNLLCLIVSCIFLVSYIFFDNAFLEYVRGLRYIVSTSLVFASFVYVIFLSSNKKNKISDKEFNGISGNKVNFILHYLCPIISLISFILFERNISLENSIWTLLVIIPSCLYWIIYLILTFTKVWKEPYVFSDSKTKNIIFDILGVLSIPLLFIIVSFVIWNLR